MDNNTIRAGKLAQKCPYCNQALVELKCVTIGCEMKTACDAGYTFKEQVVEHPEVTIEIDD